VFNLGRNFGKCFSTKINHEEQQEEKKGNKHPFFSFERNSIPDSITFISIPNAI
jgi:hypothetical protein